jgi:hypothetical protein
MGRVEQAAAGGPGVYVRVCNGNAWAGLFLYRMAFLVPRALRVIDGKLWYVQSREQALTYWGCSQKMYDKTMRFLRSNGLIETRYSTSFKDRAAMRTTAFRLTELAINRVQYEAVQGRRAKDEDVVVGEQMHEEDIVKGVLGSADLRDNGRTHGGATGRIHGGATGRIHSGCEQVKEIEKGREERKDLLRLRGVKADSKILGKESLRKGVGERLPNSLIRDTFRDARAKFINDQHKDFFPGWGDKEFRAGRLFCRKIQEANAQNKQDIDPLAVITRCVERWEFFREFALDEYKHKLPEQPFMLALLGALEPAIAYYLQGQAKVLKFQPKLPKLSELFKNDKPTG